MNNEQEKLLKLIAEQLKVIDKDGNMLCVHDWILSDRNRVDVDYTLFECTKCGETKCKRY